MEDQDSPDGGERGFASSPCMMHELDEHETATATVGHGTPAPADVASWRRSERKRQLERRLALDAGLRQQYSAQIAERLEAAIGDVTGLIVSAYWPMRGEPDLRDLMERIARRGGRCALPVVAERGQPLLFRSWRHGERLERGVWNILVPADGVPLEPDVLIAPVVAFDRNCYRLGYGGGYFDRTLGAKTGKRRVFGVGYALAAIDTIHPQPHDVPMDAIVTEAGIHAAPMGA